MIRSVGLQMSNSQRQEGGRSSTLGICEIQNHISVWNLSALLPVKFQRISAMSGRGLEDYISIDEHLLQFIFLQLSI